MYEVRSSCSCFLDSKMCSERRKSVLTVGKVFLNPIRRFWRGHVCRLEVCSHKNYYYKGISVLWKVTVDYGT